MENKKEENNVDIKLNPLHHIVKKMIQAWDRSKTTAKRKCRGQAKQKKLKNLKMCVCARARAPPCMCVCVCMYVEGL